jgi:hypothetical protein
MAVCSEIHIKHINTAVWAERRILSVKLVVHIVTTWLQRVNLCDRAQQHVSRLLRSTESVSQSVCLSVSQSASQSVCQSVSLSVCLSVCHNDIAPPNATQ